MSLACSLFEPLSFTSRTFLVYQLRNLCGESMLDKEDIKACDGCEGVSVGFEVYGQYMYRRTYLAFIHVNDAVCVCADTDDGVFRLGVDGVRGEHHAFLAMASWQYSPHGTNCGGQPCTSANKPVFAIVLKILAHAASRSMSPLRIWW